MTPIFPLLFAIIFFIRYSLNFTLAVLASSVDFADFPPYTLKVSILSLYFRYFVVEKAMEAEKLY